MHASGVLAVERGQSLPFLNLRGTSECGDPCFGKPEQHHGEEEEEEEEGHEGKGEKRHCPQSIGELRAKQRAWIAWIFSSDREENLIPGGNIGNFFLKTKGHFHSKISFVHFL